MPDGSWLQLTIVILILVNTILNLVIAKSIRTVHILMNSRMSELLLASVGAARAEGAEQGRLTEKSEQKDATPLPLPVIDKKAEEGVAKIVEAIEESKK